MQDIIVIGGNISLNNVIGGDMDLSNVIDGQAENTLKGDGTCVWSALEASV